MPMGSRRRFQIPGFEQFGSFRPVPLNLVRFFLEHFRIGIHAVGDRCNLVDMGGDTLRPVKLSYSPFSFDFLPRCRYLLDGVRYDCGRVP